MLALSIEAQFINNIRIRIDFLLVVHQGYHVVQEMHNLFIIVLAFFLENEGNLTFPYEIIFRVFHIVSVYNQLPYIDAGLVLGRLGVNQAEVLQDVFA